MFLGFISYYIFEKLNWQLYEISDIPNILFWSEDVYGPECYQEPWSIKMGNIEFWELDALRYATTDYYLK